jgi:integrase
MSTRGLGGIRYRKQDDRWMAVISFQGVKRVLYSKTRDEALLNLQKLQSMKSAGTIAIKAPKTTASFLQEYLDDIAPQHLRSNTILCYSDTIRLHISPYLGHIKLADLSPQDIYKWLGAMKKSGASDRMRQLAFSVLSSALQHALPEALSYITKDPTLGVKSPKVSKKTFEVWDADEVRKFLDVVQNDTLYPLFFMALTMGMRQGELLGLDWADILWDRGVIFVQKTLIEQKGKVIGRFDPKSKKSRRVISMPASLAAVLLEYRRASGGVGLVFKNDGEPFTKAQIVAHFEGLIKQAGLKRIRFHDLRHSSNTLLLSKGVHVKVMQDRAGHADSGTTLNIYGHVLPAMDMAAAQAMEELVGVRSPAISHS